MTADQPSPARPPVVLRFADMAPAQIARFEAHRLRKGQSGEHIDPSKANRLLIGSETWASEALHLIERMRRHNHLIEAETLRRRGQAKALMNCCQFRRHEDKIVIKELESGYDETKVQP